MTKLTDEFILGAALQYDELGATIKKLEADRQDLRDTIVGELDRRGAKALECDGHRVLAIQNMQSDYLIDEAKATLPRARFTAITKTIVDREAVKAEIDAGRIGQDVADAFTVKTPRGAKYPRLVRPKV